MEKFDLFRLEQYTGCISGFGCKSDQHKGHCVCGDGLTQMLDAIRVSDGLIIAMMEHEKKDVNRIQHLNIADPDRTGL